MRTVLEYDLEWAMWCANQLALAPAYLVDADFHEAGATWTWLTQSQLLTGTLAYQAAIFACAAGAGVGIGVALAYQTVCSALHTDHHGQGEPDREGSSACR